MKIRPQQNAARTKPNSVIRKVSSDSASKPKRSAGSASRKKTQFVVLTIGHSTRSLAEFVELLRAYEVSLVADVRTVPRSRYNPQFNKETLAKNLEKEGLHYVHWPGLGGLRHTKRDSINTAWRNASFRGYADYMQTPEFKQSLDELIKRARRERTALMCAEAVPWRCHRSLIADALLVRGIRAEDIIGPKSRRVHTLTPFAKVRGLTITYPAPPAASKLEAPAPAPRARRAATTA